MIAAGNDGKAAAGATGAWLRFVALFVAVALGLGLAVVAFVAVVDPYGLRAAPGRPPGPLMDSNQRFMYPQVVRSRAYDSAVFGSSTSRLLDPTDLNRSVGGRFANLAMNAATPYEQVEMARLFLRNVTPRGVLFGLDRNWCDPDADTQRFTPRPFPAWLYAEDAPFATLRQVNWQSLTAAFSVLLHRFGRAPARLRADGYAVFTPPESSYDAARAAGHIHGGPTRLDDQPVGASPQDAAAAADAMPALPWLDGILGAMPRETVKTVAFMPVNVVEQGAPGTAMGRREALCKARVAEIGRRHGAMVVDFRIPSPVTANDANYWDALHYRLPIAGRIVDALAAARASGVDDAGGFYRVLAHP